MARYGQGFERGRRGMRGYGGGMGRGYGSDYGYGAGPEDFRGGGFGGGAFGGRGGGRGGEYGGMRSDAYGTSWDQFPGEEGWFGEGYAGYPGGDYRGEDRGYAGYGGGMRGGQEMGYGGGMGIGREMGYGGEYGGGWQRGRGSDADRVRAADIMTENPETVTPETTVADVAKKMKDLDVGIIPVVDSTENRKLRGVITDRDLAVRVLAEGKDGKTKVSDYMSSDVETINKNDTVRDVLNVMKKQQIRRVPVTDREGRLVGIIAQADLAVDYAGLDLQRETEVEEAIERISEPARPRRGGRGGW